MDRTSGDFIREGNIFTMIPELIVELENSGGMPAESLIFEGSYKTGTYKELDASLYVCDPIQSL